MAKINAGHYLMGCRLDNWLRLLWQNRFRIQPARVLQALAITGVSLALAPFALLEAALFSRRLHKLPLRPDPVFIIGHWRSGTTFLQNLMAQDPQFGWCDPVSTATVSYCLLLGRLLAPAENKALRGARPMDNMVYRLDLPIEDTFGVATISDCSIIHMIAFPRNYKYYFATAFVDELPEKKRAQWERSYMYLMRRVSYMHHGKRLMLKSPDNTCHIPALQRLFPDARFVNIHRDPYTTVMSTINMFKKQMSLLDLGPMPAGPEEMEQMLEDSVIGIFEKMYRTLFAQEAGFAPQHYVDVKYEDFETDPERYLRYIYDQLGIEGFEAARPRIRAYIDSQKNYQKNRFQLEPALRQKINDRLGFYFEHYGYEMQTEA